jgi:phage I-like protein
MPSFVKSVLEIACKDGAVPEWVLVLPLGRVESSKGTFVVDAAGCRAITAQVAALGRDLVVDYEHQTLGGGEAPAAGWIKEFALRDDGLWARVEWTERGAGRIAAREYRYLSPTISVDKKTRRVVGLHSVALTNDPAIKNMRPIANRRAAEEEDGMDELRKALGLAEGATEQDVVDSVKSLVALSASAREALALPAEAGAAELRGAVLALKNPAGYVPRAEFVALKERLDRGEAAALVERALAEGKITPATKAWAESYALKDRAGFDAFVTAAPVVVPLGRQAATESPASGGVTEADEAVCRQLGIAPSAVKGV